MNCPNCGSKDFYQSPFGYGGGDTSDCGNPSCGHFKNGSIGGSGIIMMNLSVISSDNKAPACGKYLVDENREFINFHDGQFHEMYLVSKEYPSIVSSHFRNKAFACHYKNPGIGIDGKGCFAPCVTLLSSNLDEAVKHYVRIHGEEWPVPTS